MPRIYDIDNPSPAAESFGRWLENKTRLPVTAREVMAHWVYGKDWEGERRDAGRPFTNRTHSVDDPSEPATAYAAFLADKGISVAPPHIQAMWKYHREWQSSPERRKERGYSRIRQPEVSSIGRYFILNQGFLEKGAEHKYDDVEGERYHWTLESSGASKQLADSAGAGFVYYRPRTAPDGTAQHYFGHGRVADVQTQPDGSFVANLEGYERFQRFVPSSEGPPRINHTNSISRIPEHDFHRLVRLGAGDIGAEGELTLDSIRDAVVKAHLKLDEGILAQLLAALSSEKHVILTGPPGTAKTTLAQAVAEAAQQVGECSGFMPTTATADWTTFETIGGLRPTGPDKLEFEEGHFLKAIRDDHWLLIDELNRAHFDRAFGQLFTVLSGQPVVLPYSRPQSDGKPLVLLPSGADSPIDDGDVLQIPRRWRIIATMNVFDKSLLFEMSFALMRRFAFIEVASPPVATFEELIDEYAADETRAATLAKQLLVLRGIKDLGPAVFIDLTKFLRERISLLPAGDGQLLFEAFYSYLLPQFEGIDVPTGEELFKTMSTLMDSAEGRNRLRQTLNNVLGLELLVSSTQHQNQGDQDQTVDLEEP